MNILHRYDNVTVLYGHIHRDDEHEEGNIHHFGAKSLIFGFPDPQKSAMKKPMPFAKDHPFQNLGIRSLDVTGAGVQPHEVELTMRELSGMNGIHQLLKEQSI